MLHKKMDTTVARAFRHVKNDMYVEVVTFYLNIYDGMGNKTSTRQEKEEFRQVFYAVPAETKGVHSPFGTETWEFPDGRKVLMIGTGKNLQGQSL